MSPLLVKVCKDFATIWTTIDPIGNVAIFAGLTAALTRAERRRTALRASLYAAVILVVAVVAGQIILDAIGFVCTRSKWQAESSCSCSRCKCFSGDWIPTQDRPSRDATWPCFPWQCLPSRDRAR